MFTYFTFVGNLLYLLSVDSCVLHGMWQAFHLTGKKSSSRITGLLGGRIMVKCKHPKEKPKARFFCKETQGECQERTDTKVQNEWQHHGTYSLYDDISGASLMVFFRNLSEGMYRCGVAVSEFGERYIEVKMEVKRGKNGCPMTALSTTQ